MEASGLKLSIAVEMSMLTYVGKASFGPGPCAVCSHHACTMKSMRFVLIGM